MQTVQKQVFIDIKAAIALQGESIKLKIKIKKWLQ